MPASGIWQKHDLFIFFNTSIKLSVRAGFAKKNRMCWMTCYSMTRIKIRGRVVMAAAGFVTSVLAWLPRFTAHAVRGASSLLSADFLFCISCTVVSLLWIELNSSNVDVSTIIMWMVVKSYSLRSLQMKGDEKVEVLLQEVGRMRCRRLKPWKWGRWSDKIWVVAAVWIMPCLCIPCRFPG